MKKFQKMSTTCVIEFKNNPNKVIYSGQLLAGAITIKISKPKTIRGIFIKITGEAHAHWSEGGRKHRRLYTGHEEYIKEKMYLIGSDYDEIHLTPGAYKFTFESQLPAELPTSTEGCSGYIRYQMFVVFDVPIWPNRVFDTPFTVIKPVILENMPKLHEPLIAKKEKSFISFYVLFCCISDPLNITAWAPVQGYLPGETIFLELITGNRSNQTVLGFTVRLIKEITYISNGSTRKIERTVISEKETYGCDPRDHVKYQVNILLPTVLTPTDTTNNVLQIRYYFRVRGSVECHMNPVLEFPIVIGTHPTRNALAAPLALAIRSTTATTGAPIHQQLQNLRNSFAVRQSTPNE